MINLKKIIVITGHYGSGKTNVSANLALHLAEFGSVSIIDLDVVNPYFRAADLRCTAEGDCSDAARFFSEKGVSIVASKYANSSLDIPALGFAVTGAIKTSDYTVIDVGGDDEGAKALGRYLDILSPEQTDMFYVVNMYRYHTQKPQEALDLLRDIETVSGLKCTGIINNSHLCTQTTPETITASLPYAEEIAKQAGVPLVFTTGNRELNCKNVNFPIDILVKPIWV
ncbi:MAG: cobalamin biosynthesis protein CobQ [Oscillospiraceae bacterium]|nr:cobalamin biosynthesis protein CobQ [Oscillospiraceae bacterium]